MRGLLLQIAPFLPIVAAIGLPWDSHLSPGGGRRSLAMPFSNETATRRRATN